MRRITLVTVVFVALASLGACGGGGSDSPTVVEPGSSSQATEAPSSAAAGGIEQARTVQIAKTSLGDVLVDENQKTIYRFENDTGTDSTCTGTCANTWPAVKAGSPTAGDGVDASKLTSNAAGQVVYNGHPLYTYSGDTKPGDTNGEGIGDKWFAVSAAGESVKG